MDSLLPVIGQIALYFFSSLLLARGNRVPFDLSEAESELVSGYTTEYSGIKFALFYLAEYVHLLCGQCTSFNCIFFGGPNGPIINSNILIVTKSLIFFTIILFVR